jgi:hypothetical protein
VDEVSRWRKQLIKVRRVCQRTHAGLPEFSLSMTPKPEKMYQMAIKYINIFQSFQKLSKLDNLKINHLATVV